MRLIFFFLILNATLLLLGLVFSKYVLSKKIELGNYIFFAPAFSLIFFVLIAVISYVINFPLLIPISMLAALGLMGFNLKFLWQYFRALNRFTWVILISISFVFFLQATVYFLNQDNHPAPGNTWQIYSVSGVSPPDQSFAWHQARFFRNNLIYSQDLFYGDIDLFDRPFVGGFITNYVLYFFDIPKDIYPDLSFDLNDSYMMFVILWWSLNNLCVLGIAYLISVLFEKKYSILATILIIFSPFVFKLNFGLWPKMLPVYLLCLTIVLVKKQKLPLMQGILAGFAFYLHGTLLPFILALGIYYVVKVINSYIKKTNYYLQIKALLSFGVAGIVIVGSWFVLAVINHSPQSLSFAYLYNTKWTELNNHRDDLAAYKQQKIIDFYNKTQPLKLIALPLMNITKSIVPSEMIQSVAETDHKPIDGLAKEEYLTFSAILGVFLIPFLIWGSWLMIQDRKWSFESLYLYIIPTIIIALAYRRDNIITNYIVSPYIIMAIISICYLFRKYLLKLWLIFSVISLTTINFLVSLLFSRVGFSDIKIVPLIYKNIELGLFDLRYIALIGMVLSFICWLLREYKIEASLSNTTQ